MASIALTDLDITAAQIASGAYLSASCFVSLDAGADAESVGLQMSFYDISSNLIVAFEPVITQTIVSGAGEKQLLLTGIRVPETLHTTKEEFQSGNPNWITKVPADFTVPPTSGSTPTISVQVGLVYAGTPTGNLIMSKVQVNNASFVTEYTKQSSGGDADTLDGLDSTQFLRSDESDTTSGILTVEGGILTDRISARTGDELVLNAGDSLAIVNPLDQLSEVIYINAENGLEINSSPNDWGGLGWDDRHTAILCDLNGDSTFPGNITLTGTLDVGQDIELEPTGKLYLDGGLTEGFGDTYLYEDVDNNISFVSNNVERFSVDTLGAEVIGDLRVSDTVVLDNGSVTFPSLSFKDDLDTGIYQSAGVNAGNILFGTDGVERLEISSAGFSFTGDVLSNNDIQGDWTFYGFLTAEEGLQGNYDDWDPSTLYGSNIWSISKTYTGTAGGDTWGPLDLHGLAWLRNTNTNADAEVGEGLYLYQNGVQLFGAGAVGLSIDGDFTMSGSVTSDMVFSGTATFNNDVTTTALLQVTGTFEVNTDIELEINKRLYWAGAAGNMYMFGDIDDSINSAILGTTRLKVDSSGINVTGGISVTGVVDGRDIAADGATLDGLTTDLFTVSAGGPLSTMASGYEYRVTGNSPISTAISGIGASGHQIIITHGSAAGDKHIPTGGSVGQVLENSASGTAVWATISSEGGDADTLGGRPPRTVGDNWGVVPHVSTNGQLEIGRYLDFHGTDADTGNYSWRISVPGVTGSLSFQSSSGAVRAVMYDTGGLSIEQGSSLYLDGTPSTATGTTYIQSDVAGNVRTVISSTERLNVNSTGVQIVGTLSATVVNATSDENLKDVLGVHTPRDISKLSAKEWTWKNPEVSQGVQIGYIAQEVEKYLPEAVEVSEGVKTLNYNAVHTSKIANLERELQELKLLVKELTNGRTN